MESIASHLFSGFALTLNSVLIFSLYVIKWEWKKEEIWTKVQTEGLSFRDPLDSQVKIVNHNATDISKALKRVDFKLCLVEHTCNPSTVRAAVKGSLFSNLARLCLNIRVQRLIIGSI